MCELLSSLSSLHCGHEFTISIDKYYNIWSFGLNYNGKCCFNIKEKIIYPPKKISLLSNIKFIACGANHTICCDFNGKIYSFGDNYYGQLGICNKELSFSSIPQELDLPPIKQISSGFYFSICLTDDGYLYSFGLNTSGELGIGNNAIESLSSPQLISQLDNISYVQCGGFMVICKSLNDKYYVWGKGTSGQLGLGNVKNIQIPTLNDNIPDNIMSIRSTTNHMLLLSSDGIVYGCGGNSTGQLGFSSVSLLKLPSILSLPPIKKISCGYNHSLCIDYNNDLWVFGCNSNGQLGLGHTRTLMTPIKHPLLQNIIDISVRSDSTFVKTSNNEIFAMGNNNHSQLGLPIKENIINKPTKVLQDIDEIWNTNFNSRQKSARK